MGYSIGYNSEWDRDIGYGVPAYCDSPRCIAEIDRGMGYVCEGCGLYFCSDHLYGKCARCTAYKSPYKEISPEHPDWIKHKLTDPSWKQWRKENPEEVNKLKIIKSKE